MTRYRKYTPTEIESMAKSLKQQLSDGLLPEDILEIFKFRGPEGNTWTVLPQTNAWYCYKSGRWQTAKAPEKPLDGTIELLNMVALPIPPIKTDKPEENEPVKQDPDIRQMLERATKRVRDSYNHGKINSAGAENLLKELYLLDPAGLIWSYGLHTEEWYFFRQDDWEISTDGGPDPLDFHTKQKDSPSVCSNCGTPLLGGKFCSECGTPIPDPESPYSQAAKEVIVRFTESDAASLPEQIVPDWKPAPGFPETIAGSASAPMAAQSSNQQSQWKLRVSQGVGTGQSFHLGARTRLGHKKANEIVLADQQSSGLHAVIQRQANSYVITDQNSINGTFVNGVRIQAPTTLHPGDTISIGGTHFVVEREASAPDTIERQRSTQAQTPGDVQQASSASQPRNRKRMIFLIIISLLVVTCLCCFVLGIIENYY
jgi:ribosomal protein L32